MDNGQQPAANEKSCRPCWFQEGGRCYVEPVDRIESGRLKGYSRKRAEKRCGDYKGKRAVLSALIPNAELVIVSELRHAKGGRKC